MTMKIMKKVDIHCSVAFWTFIWQVMGGLSSEQTAGVSLADLDFGMSVWSSLAVAVLVSSSLSEIKAGPSYEIMGIDLNVI